MKVDPDQKLATLGDKEPSLDSVGAGSHVPDIEVEIKIIKRELNVWSHP